MMIGRALSAADTSELRTSWHLDVSHLVGMSSKVYFHYIMRTTQNGGASLNQKGKNVKFASFPVN